MVWFLVAQLFSTLISLIQIGRMSESEKDLEIMVLRYQLGIAERKMQKPVRANRAERMTLAVLAAKLKEQTNRPAVNSRKRYTIELAQTIHQQNIQIGRESPRSNPSQIAVSWLGHSQ